MADSPFDAFGPVSRRRTQMSRSGGAYPDPGYVPDDTPVQQPNPQQQLDQEADQEGQAALAQKQRQDQLDQAAQQKAQDAQTKQDTANWQDQAKVDAANDKADGVITRGAVIPGPDGKDINVQARTQNPDGTTAYKPEDMGIQTLPDGSAYRVNRDQWGKQTYSDPYQAGVNANVALNAAGQVMATPKGKGAADLQQKDVSTDPNALNQPQITAALDDREQKLVGGAAKQRVADTVQIASDQAASDFSDAQQAHQDALKAVTVAKANQFTDPDSFKQATDAELAARQDMIAKAQKKNDLTRQLRDAKADPLNYLEQQQSGVTSPVPTTQPQVANANTPPPNSSPVLPGTSQTNAQVPGVQAPVQAASGAATGPTPGLPAAGGAAGTPAGASAPLPPDPTQDPTVTAGSTPLSEPPKPAPQTWGDFFSNLKSTIPASLAKGAGTVTEAFGTAADMAKTLSGGRLAESAMNMMVKPFMDPATYAKSIASQQQPNAATAAGRQIVDAANAILSGPGVVPLGGKRALVADPRYKDNFVTNSLNSTAEMVPTMIAKPVMAAQGYQTGVDDARAAGKSPLQQQAAGIVNGVTYAAVGHMAEALPLFKSTLEGGSLFNILQGGAKKVTAEVLAEVARAIPRTVVEGLGFNFGNEVAQGTNPYSLDPTQAAQNTKDAGQSVLGMLPFALLPGLGKAASLRDASRQIDENLAAINKGRAMPLPDGTPPRPPVDRASYIASLIQQAASQRMATALSAVQKSHDAIDANPNMPPAAKLATKNQILNRVPPDLRPTLTAHLDAAADAKKQTDAVVQGYQSTLRSIPKADPALAHLSDTDLQAEHVDVTDRLQQPPAEAGQPDPTVREGLPQATPEYQARVQSEIERRQQVQAAHDDMASNLQAITDHLTKVHQATTDLAAKPGGLESLAALNAFNARQDVDAPRATAVTAQMASDLAPASESAALVPHYLPVAHQIEQLGNPDQKMMATAALKLVNGRSLNSEEQALMLGDPTTGAPGAVDADTQKPFVTQGDDGKPVLTDAGLGRLKTLVPASADILPGSEQAQREAQAKQAETSQVKKSPGKAGSVKPGKVNQPADDAGGGGPVLPPHPHHADVEDEALQARIESMTAAMEKTRAGGGQMPPSAVAELARLRGEQNRRANEAVPAKEGDDIQYHVPNAASDSQGVRSGQVVEVHPDGYSVTDAESDAQHRVPFSHVLPRETKAGNPETKGPQSETLDDKTATSPAASETGAKAKAESAGGSPDKGVPSKGDVTASRTTDEQLCGISGTEANKNPEATSTLKRAVMQVTGDLKRLGLSFKTGVLGKKTIGLGVLPSDPTHIVVDLEALQHSIDIFKKNGLTPEEIDAHLQAVLGEEADHSVHENVATEMAKEISTPEKPVDSDDIFTTLWHSLTPDQRRAAHDLYPHLHLVPDGNKGREYARMIQQLIRDGKTSEVTNLLTPKARSFFQKVADYLKGLMKGETVVQRQVKGFNNLRATARGDNPLLNEILDRTTAILDAPPEGEVSRGGPKSGEVSEKADVPRGKEGTRAAQPQLPGAETMDKPLFTPEPLAKSEVSGDAVTHAEPDATPARAHDDASNTPGVSKEAGGGVSPGQGGERPEPAEPAQRGGPGSGQAARGNEVPVESRGPAGAPTGSPGEREGAKPAESTGPTQPAGDAAERERGAGRGVDAGGKAGDETGSGRHARALPEVDSARRINRDASARAGIGIKEDKTIRDVTGRGYYYYGKADKDLIKRMAGMSPDTLHVFLKSERDISEDQLHVALASLTDQGKEEQAAEIEHELQQRDDARAEEAFRAEQRQALHEHLGPSLAEHLTGGGGLPEPGTPLAGELGATKPNAKIDQGRGVKVSNEYTQLFDDYRTLMKTPDDELNEYQQGLKARFKKSPLFSDKAKKPLGETIKNANRYKVKGTDQRLYGQAFVEALRDDIAGVPHYPDDQALDREPVAGGVPADAQQAAQDYLDKNEDLSFWLHKAVGQLFQRAARSGRNAVSRLIDRIEAGKMPRPSGPVVGSGPRWEGDEREKYLPTKESIPGTVDTRDMQNAALGMSAALHYQEALKERANPIIAKALDVGSKIYQGVKGKAEWNDRMQSHLGNWLANLRLPGEEEQSVKGSLFDFVAHGDKSPLARARFADDLLSHVRPVVNPTHPARLRDGKIVRIAPSIERDRVNRLIESARQSGQRRFSFTDGRGATAQIYTANDGSTTVRLPSSNGVGGDFKNVKAAVQHLVDNGFDFQSATIEKKLARDATVQRFTAMIMGGLKLGQNRFHFSHDDGRTAALIARKDGKFSVAGLSDVKQFSSARDATGYLQDRGFGLQSSKLERDLRTKGLHPDQANDPVPYTPKQRDTINQYRRAKGEPELAAAGAAAHGGVDDEEIGNYLSRNGVHEEKAGKEIRAAFAQSDLPGFAVPYDDAETGPGEVQREDGKTDKVARAQVLKNPADVERLKTAFKGGDTISSILPEYVGGRIPSFDLKGKKVTSPSDFAKLAWAVRSPYVETLKVAVIGNGGKIAHSEVLTVGNLNEALIDMPGMVRAVQQVAGKTNYRRVVISHNHPSGDPTPSTADVTVTKKMEFALQNAGIELVDHIITNGTKFTSSRNGWSTEEIPGGGLSPWEAVPRDDLAKIKDDRDLAQIARGLRQASPDHDHIIYLNTQHAVTGIERVPKMQDTYAGMLDRITHGVAREGANGVLLDTSDLNANLAKRLSGDLQGITKLLDVSAANGPASFRAQGLLEDPADYHPGEEPVAGSGARDTATADMFESKPDVQPSLAKDAALKIYRALSALRDKNLLKPGQAQLLERAEKALGQKFIDGLEDATAKPAPTKGAPPKVNFGKPETGIKHELEATPKDFFDQRPEGQHELFGAGAQDREALTIPEFEPKTVSQKMLGYVHDRATTHAPDLANAAKTLAGAKDELLQVIAPHLRGEQARKAGRILVANLPEIARNRDIAQEALKKTSAYFDSKTPEENLPVLYALDEGTKTGNPDVDSMIQTMREMNVVRRDRIRAMPNSAFKNFLVDYLPHIFHPDDVDAARQYFQRKIEGSTAFLKHRTIPSLRDALNWERPDGTRLRLVSYNPADLYQIRWHQMDKHYAAQKIAADMQDNDLAKPYASPADAPFSWLPIQDQIGMVLHQQELDPDEDPKEVQQELIKRNDGSSLMQVGNKMVKQRVQRLYAPAEVAQILNNYLSPGLRDKATYKIISGVANTLNQAQLGLSAFHAGFTTFEAMTSKLALGLEKAHEGRFLEAGGDAAQALTGVAAITNLMRGDKLLKEWLRPGTQGDEVAKLLDVAMQGGMRVKQDERYADGWSRAFMQHLRQGSYGRAALRAPFAAVEAASKPIMNWLVPRQKLGIYMDLAKNEMRKLGPDATQDDVRKAMQSAWKSVDNRMGQVVYDNYHFNKSAKDLAMIAFRSVGWNLGTFEELGGGAIHAANYLKDAATGQKPQFSHRMAYSIALPVLTAWAGGLMTYLATGDRPKDWKDYFFPRTGGFDQNGNPTRDAMPTYMKDVFAFEHQPGQTLMNKANPIWSIAYDLIQNKDYSSTEIAHPDDSWFQRQIERGQFVAKSFVPFGIEGGLKRHSEGATVANTLAPEVGLTPAPKWVNESAAQQKADQLEEDNQRQGTRTQEEADRTHAKGALGNKLRADPTHKTWGQLIKDAVQSKVLSPKEVPTFVKDQTTLKPIQRQVKYLELGPATQVWKLASPEEKTLLRPLMLEKVSKAVADEKLTPAEAQNIIGDVPQTKAN